LRYFHFTENIDDSTHEIVGTDYNLQTLKKGNQELENWLRSLLSRNADFDFYTVPMNGKNVGVLIIYRAANQTVTFEKVDYIRVGSYTKKLNEYPAIQAQLWDRIRNSKFEERYAKQDLELKDALRLLDYSVYFDIIGIPQPTDINGISHYIQEEEIIAKQDNGLYAITNLGAILFAKRLADFPKISRKAIRVVQYSGNNRMNMLKEDVGGKGYVVGFEGLIKFIEALIPTQEIITSALREKKTAYPIVAVREAVANALIHQDFSVTGTGPVVEIFEKRMEITNSGTPLVDVKRIIDNPPKSRNEKLAALMRRLRMCEELGTGWDKIVISSEMLQLPAPKIELYEDSTRVTLFSEVPFSSISAEDRLWACYLHACIKQVQGEQLTNSSLRKRFGLRDSSSGNISRLIKEAVDLKLIKPLDPTTAPRYMKYIPIWA
jgi:ATP-dependent DNA helicase RecG